MTLHVSTLLRHAQGVCVQCLLSYINIWMRNWWYTIKKVHGTNVKNVEVYTTAIFAIGNKERYWRKYTPSKFCAMVKNAVKFKIHLQQTKREIKKLEICLSR
jgi:hypothetical protein